LRTTLAPPGPFAHLAHHRGARLAAFTVRLHGSLLPARRRRDQLLGALRLSGFGSLVKSTTDKRQLALLAWRAFGARARSASGGVGTSASVTSAGILGRGERRRLGVAAAGVSASAARVSRAALSDEFEPVAPLDDSGHWVDSDEVSVTLDGDDGDSDASDSHEPATGGPRGADVPADAAGRVAEDDGAHWKAAAREASDDPAASADEWCDAASAAASTATLVVSEDEHAGESGSHSAPAPVSAPATDPSTARAAAAGSDLRPGVKTRQIAGLADHKRASKGRRRHIGWVYEPIVQSQPGPVDASTRGADISSVPAVLPAPEIDGVIPVVGHPRKRDAVPSSRSGKRRRRSTHCPPRSGKATGVQLGGHSRTLTVVAAVACVSIAPVADGVDG
jgi:hypothetical protein